jgi:endonuclease III
MNNQEQLAAIRQKLLAFGDSLSAEILLPTVVPEAAPLVATDPYAFAIAACLDRGIKAEIIWTIPYYIKSDLGHLDPCLIYKMSVDELAAVFARLPQRPRYVNDAPRTIRDLTRIVIEECDGDASNLWKDKRAMEVVRAFKSIHGVGLGIANLTVLLIEKNFRVRFSDLDHSRMDIKPDVHTVRVLYRLGISDESTTDSAIVAARRLNPEFPGGVDGALWVIGRRFCLSSDPNCRECPMEKKCTKRNA